MRKRIALILACLLLLSAAPLALAQTIAPGAEVTVEFPFSGTASYIIHAKYTLSPGLSFVSGSMEGVFGGKAGSKEAIYVSNLPAPTTGGKLILKVKAAADATGEQTVTLTEIRGYAPSAWHALTGAGAKTVTVSGSTGGNKYDINKDGEVTMRDALLVFYASLDDVPVTEKPTYDINGDGVITMRDALLIFYVSLDS